MPSTRSWTRRPALSPKTELMLCSGGGGRVDYGALKYFDEFWPSDNTDPVGVPMQGLLLFLSNDGHR